MSLSVSDLLLLAVVVCTGAAYAAPAVAAALEARKASRLARVVAAGGRMAATIAVELRAVPAGATSAELRGALLDAAVERLKSPELLGGTIAKLGASDTGVRAVVEGELSKLLLTSDATASLTVPVEPRGSPEKGA